jgi:acetyl coenzyme A synthetase (ADP forming)-like protein
MTAMFESLKHILQPRSVAVVGASRRAGSIGAEVFRNLVNTGFTGPVYPVNQNAQVVQDVRAFGSLLEIPGDVDLAVIVVPKDKVLAVVDDCITKGVEGIVVLTAGFGEVGADGRSLQEQVRAKILSHGIRMIGPNCLGVLNTHPDVRLNATFAPNWPPQGNVAIASQSGAVGLALLDYARHLGIGISQFVSMGNKVDVSGNDLIEYWEKDDETRVIALYLESLGNPKRFMQLAGRVSRTKPIVVVKSGRTEAGARAAASHTGALAGMDIAVDALFHQAGVLRTDTVEELFDLVTLLSNQPVPKGNRVAILTNAGGPGIMASDACESRGLAMAKLTDETVKSLRAVLPPEAAVNNPVDMIASAPAKSYEQCLQTLLADDGVDVVLVLFVPPLVTDPLAVSQSICRAVSGTDKTVLVCLLGTDAVHGGEALLREAHVPTYRFPEAAIVALASAVRYRQFLERPRGVVQTPSSIDEATAKAVMERARARGEGWLTGDETRDLLQAFGLRMPRTAMATSRKEAADVAEEMGYPVALKLLSRSITHKTEVNGVHLGIRGPSELARAYEAIEAGARATGIPDAMDGVLVQQMIVGGVEMYVGMTEAAAFGALVGFGAGGIAVEVYRDVAFRVHPLTDVDARGMLEQVRAKVLLRGFRGKPPADEPALLDAILRIDHLIGTFPEIREMDVNPLVALPVGEGVIALDARVRVG